MGTIEFDVKELSSRFAEIKKLAESGTMVIVTEGAVPVAKLFVIPLTCDQPRIPGLHAGMIEIADDFDAPLPDDFWTGES
jgi:antitoxin (DNA-binding transcriptional repressor) of toxin-antitoxin stability system